jgi:hypothetical protein
LAGFGDDARGVVIKFFILVPGDDPARSQGLNGIDGPAPSVAPSVRRFAEVLVDAIVDHVAGHDQAEITDVQNAGLVGVAMADLDNDEIVTLEGEAVVGRCDRDVGVRKAPPERLDCAFRCPIVGRDPLRICGLIPLGGDCRALRRERSMWTVWLCIGVAVAAFAFGVAGLYLQKLLPEPPNALKHSVV